MKKNLFSILICIIGLFIFNSNIHALTLGELKGQLSSAEAKYSRNQESKNQTEAQIAETKAKISALNKEKAEAQENINKLNEELAQLAKDIEQMQKEIKNIVNYYQLSDSESFYLEYIFNAVDYTDFIYRLAVSEQLSEYRRNKISEFNKTIENNNKKLEELAVKQASLNKVQNELSNQYQALGKNLSSITEEAVDIKEEIKGLKRQVNNYQNTYKCSLDEQLSSCISRYNRNNAGSIGSLPSAAGFYRPIASGALNYEFGYTAAYGGYHDGIDFSISHGTPVYSVADGVVVSVKPHQSCGGNMVYIAHELNGRTYTSAYFHLADPILVSEGQEVSYNTMIGRSGGVHAIEYWDSPSCSTGAHLHFQIATGVYMRDYFWYSNFKSRSFNPRNVINFPSTGVRFSGR